MSFASDWSLPQHTSDTEHQKASKGDGGELDIARDECQAKQFGPGGAKLPRPNRTNGKGMLRTDR